MELDLKNISEQITGIGADVKEQVTKLKSDLSVDMDGKIKAAAKATEDALQDEISNLKAANQRITVKLDEAEQKAAATFMKNGVEKGEDFADVLKKKLDEHHDDLEKIARKDNGRNQHLTIELKAVGDITTANVTGTAWGQINRGGIILNPDRKRHVRELIPMGNLGPGSEYIFMKDAGTGEGNPAAVAEGATKPQFDIDLIEGKVPIETIAGWVRVTRKAMNNIPGFLSYLQQEMPKRLLKVEDQYLLYGTGANNQVKGLLTAGNFVASTSTADVLVERILDDISLLEDTHEREANGIVLRPAAYNSFFKNKASGSGEYDLPANVAFINGQLYISGIPVVKTTALNAPDYMVGDFSGAQFLIQEGMRIEFFEQDRDNVITNKVTVRIEETVALPVYGSNYFVKGTTVDPVTP